MRFFWHRLYVIRYMAASFGRRKYVTLWLWSLISHSINSTWTSNTSMLYSVPREVVPLTHSGLERLKYLSIQLIPWMKNQSWLLIFHDELSCLNPVFYCDVELTSSIKWWWTNCYNNIIMIVSKHKGRSTDWTREICIRSYVRCTIFDRIYNNLQHLQHLQHIQHLQHLQHSQHLQFSEHFQLLQMLKFL